MGLSVNRGPEWKDDSFGYINVDVSILNLNKDKIEEYINDNFLEMHITKENE